MSKITRASETPCRTGICSVFSNKKTPVRIASFLLFLAVWQAASMFIGSDILLASPLEVLSRLFGMMREKSFYHSLFSTFSHIAAGFLGGVVSGILLAFAADRFSVLEILLLPYVSTVKAIPVASYAVIALIWLSSSRLSMLISFLVVFPVIYTNVFEGLKSVDKKMTEMANVFKMPFRRRLRFIYIPALKPFALSAFKTSAGLAWKSGVAAELIGVPRNSVGEALYSAKLFLETADLFAWTLAVIAVSALFERLFLFFIKKIFGAVESK